MDVAPTQQVLTKLMLATTVTYCTLGTFSIFSVLMPEDFYVRVFLSFDSMFWSLADL